MKEKEREKEKKDAQAPRPATPPAKRREPAPPARRPEEKKPAVASQPAPPRQNPPPVPAEPAPAPVAAASPVAEEAEVDRALDAAFGEGASQGVTAVSQVAKELDEAAVRELYGAIASNHARPIKNLVFELKRGTATKEWIEVCRPIMATLIEGAESMGLPEAGKTMADFDAALVLAQEGASDTLGGEARELILKAFEEMALSLPEAFEIGDGEKRRESVIIHALLKQVPDVGHVTFERLYGAGLTNLEALFLANRDDLAATTGIPAWLCERICGRIQEHRKDLDRLRRDSGEGERRERLHRLVNELREQHEGFERATAGDWKDPAIEDRRREHRQGRQMCALRIDVVLAEMGELDLVEQIQKLPFELRIEKLEEFLVSTPVTVSA